MACLCQKNKIATIPTDYETLPDQPCLYCGEKHFSTAMQLAEEIGYVSVNRQRIIGELVCACWHVYKEHYPLAEKLRDIRHDIQLRRDIPQERWSEIAKEFDTLLEEKTKADLKSNA